MKTFGTEWTFVPHNDAVVFVDNHDNQRGHGAAVDILTHRDEKLYIMANVFMLSWHYGFTQIMSSFNFTLGGESQGPPSNLEGETKNVTINL